MKYNDTRQHDVSELLKHNLYIEKYMDFTLKWAFNLANYQSFRYVKQFYEIRVEIRQYSSETISKKLISI